jgi:hypothetical protein
MFSKRKGQGQATEDPGSSVHHLSNASGLGSRSKIEHAGRQFRVGRENSNAWRCITSGTKNVIRPGMRDAANFVWLASSVFVCLSFGTSLEQGGALGFQHGVAGAFAHAAL